MAGSGDLSAHPPRTAQGKSEQAALCFVLRVNDWGFFSLSFQVESVAHLLVFVTFQESHEAFHTVGPHPLCLFPGRRKASTLFHFSKRGKKKKQR